MRGTLGVYAIEGELGRGGVGRVYRVRHGPTGAVRALKVLEGIPDAIALDRWKREVEALARAGGAGVVAIHESGVDAGRSFFVMDLMEGGSLRARLTERGRLPWTEAAGVVVALARTLERCHALGLIHRDVKPENVLFDDRGEPCLADFGCVRDLSASALTATGTVLGTTAYMAPEQFAGKPIDGSVDTYALGVVLHELVTGSHPYAGTPFQTARAALAEKRVPASTLCDCPAALDRVIANALAPDPARRYATSGALALDLDAVVRGEAVEAPRSFGVALLVAVAIVFVVLAGGLVLTRFQPAPPGPPIRVKTDPVELRRAAWEEMAAWGGIIPVTSLAPLDLDHAREKEVEAFAARALEQGLDGDGDALAARLRSRFPGSPRLQLLECLESIKARRTMDPARLDELARASSLKARYVLQTRAAEGYVAALVAELDGIEKGMGTPLKSARQIREALKPLSTTPPSMAAAVMAPLTTAVWTFARRVSVRSPVDRLAVERGHEQMQRLLEALPSDTPRSLLAASHVLEVNLPGLANPGMAAALERLRREAVEVGATEPLHGTAVLVKVLWIEVRLLERQSSKGFPRPPGLLEAARLDASTAREAADGLLRSSGPELDRDWTARLRRESLQLTASAELHALTWARTTEERREHLTRVVEARTTAYEGAKNFLDLLQIVRVRFMLASERDAPDGEAFANAELAAIDRISRSGDLQEFEDVVDAEVMRCRGSLDAARKQALAAIAMTKVRKLDAVTTSTIVRHAHAVLIDVERAQGNPAKALEYMRVLIDAPGDNSWYFGRNGRPTGADLAALEREARAKR